MPDCPPKASEERGTRFELQAGKAVKDWVTRVMKQTRMTRREARIVVLEKINGANPEY